MGKVKHGHTFAGSQSLTYRAWVNMRNRCYSPNIPGFQNWGGRGITVCEQWLGENGFQYFLEDMGEKPIGLSLDRVDNDGNYEPGNCRWATRTEQSNNARSNKRYTYNGITDTQAGWAARLGKRQSAIFQRIKKGWPPEKVFSAHNYNYRVPK